MQQTNSPRIALISPQVVGAREQVRRTQPPLGLISLAAVMEQKGFNEILILDAAVEDYARVVDVAGDPDLIVFGMKNEAVVERLQAFRTGIVGISCLFSSQAECAFKLAAAIKQAMPDVPIVLGGIHASTMYAQIMMSQPTIDFIIRGEGDYAFYEFVETYGENNAHLKIPGIAYRNGSEIKTNPLSQPIGNLDALPFPTWHLLDMEKYFEIGMPHNPFVKSGRVGCIMTSRGCPQRCYFCSSSTFFGHQFRPMSSARVIAMVDYLVKRFSIRELQIEDDTFTLDFKRVIEICNGIKRHKLRVTLPNSIRADVPMNHDKRYRMFVAMKTAGCEQLGISVEHGDQDFLNNVIGKRLNLKEAVATCELAHRAGLLVHANFMMGFPFETSENRARTAEFARRLDADSFSISLATPLPGTAMWDVAQHNGLFMDTFNVNRLVYSQVSIRPQDISPEELLHTVVSLNRELNLAAKAKRPETMQKYELFEGKTAHGDRKYLS